MPALATADVRGGGRLRNEPKERPRKRLGEGRKRSPLSFGTLFQAQRKHLGMLYIKSLSFFSIALVTFLSRN